MSRSNHSTRDMPLAAYALMKGVTLAEAREVRRNHGNGPDFLFEFSCTDEEWRRLQIDWVNSESQRFDNSVRQLKKTLRGG